MVNGMRDILCDHHCFDLDAFLFGFLVRTLETSSIRFRFEDVVKIQSSIFSLKGHKNELASRSGRHIIGESCVPR